MEMPKTRIRWLLMPAEVKARDFKSRLLISCEAASKGINVVFGSQDAVFSNLDKLPRGIYFEKSIAKNKYNVLKRRIDMGFRIVSLDEEGLCSVSNPIDYLKQRVSDCTIPLADRIFVWGKEEARIISEHFKGAEKSVVVAGNPRIDLLRPEFRDIFREKAESYRKKYGRYILLPSNFTVRHAHGHYFILKQAWRMGTITNKKEEKEYREMLADIDKAFAFHTKMIEQLAAEFPDRQIIIRPHPSEDKRQWDKVKKTSNNIRVIYSGSISPWLLGADLVIHNSCTTGLEAYLLGRPVIAYLPFANRDYEKHVSNHVSLQVRELEELIAKARDILDKQERFNISKENTDELSRQVAFLSGQFSYEKIVDELLKLEWPDSRIDGPLMRFTLGKRVIASGKTITRMILIKMSLFRKKYLHTLQKFPYSTFREVRGTIDSLSMHMRDACKLDLAQVGDNLYIIRKK